MRTHGALLLLAAVSMPAGALGATLGLQDTTGDIHSVDVDLDVVPVGTFTVNVRLEIAPNEEVNGLTFQIQSFDNVNDNDPRFSLDDRTIIGFPMTNGGTLSDGITSNSDLLASPASLLDPTNDRDIGLTGPTGSKVVGSGTIMLLTIKYDHPAPRDYRFNIAPWAVTNDNLFVDHDITPGQDYIVHVSPEPATAMMLMVALIGSSLRLRRTRLSV